MSLFINTHLTAVSFVLGLFLSFSNSYGQISEPVTRGATSTQASEATETAHELVGKASFYGDEYQGRKAANGETFDNAQMTAAHKTLPFGTMVKVTRKDNGKSITVRIIDRGPFKPGRVIDLSQGAAAPIGLIRDGVIEVTLELVSTPQPAIATATNPQAAEIVLENKNIKTISAPQNDFGIQVGAFSDIKTAERATENLGKKGLSNFVIHTGISATNATVYRVIVGPFEQKEDAQKIYDTMIAGTETSGLVIDMNNLR